MVYPIQRLVGAGLLVSLAFAFGDKTPSGQGNSTMPVSCADIVAAPADGVGDDGLSVKGCEKAALR